MSLPVTPNTRSEAEAALSYNSNYQTSSAAPTTPLLKPSDPSSLNKFAADPTNSQTHPTADGVTDGASDPISAPTPATTQTPSSTPALEGLLHPSDPNNKSKHPPLPTAFSSTLRRPEFQTRSSNNYIRAVNAAVAAQIKSAAAGDVKGMDGSTDGLAPEAGGPTGVALPERLKEMTFGGAAGGEAVSGAQQGLERQGSWNHEDFKRTMLMKDQSGASGASEG
ncbi:hypothetical protein K402DRAFT_1894 [Aulographum hederae CBS 113979]|uniref:Uncharacterized protein n=1 Tax=Aulographum hederae CBS 113979 TaxID=1176131 RepID=A0A6G1HGW0_9PEZI|nr:hypothetical protein K402DRAFT_1894 [Aulographum hederae CBS 113979]